MKGLNQEIKDCRKCNIPSFLRNCGGRLESKQVMFIAESPSPRKTLSKDNPFAFIEPDGNFNVTKADELFKDIRKEFDLDNCYITDLVKCGIVNGKPTDDNFKKCKPFLEKEINLIKPKIIIAVGKTITLGNNSDRKTYNFKTFLENNLDFDPDCIFSTYHYSYMFRWKRNNKKKC